MMIRYSFIFAALLLFTSLDLFAQSRDMLMHQGDQAYEDEEFLAAQSYYTESDLKQPTIEATYNQANALFNQEKYDEAIGLWERVTDSEDVNLQASAHHNLGNAHFQSQKLDKAIDHYKKALRIKPDDPDSRRNLALAQLMQDQDPQQQQQDNQEQQDGDESDENQDNQEQQESDEPEENQDQENQESPEDQQQEEDGSGSDSSEPTEAEQLEEMTKQELDRLLEVLEEEDKKVQQKAAIKSSGDKVSDKEW